MLKSFSVKDKFRLFSCSLFWYQEVIVYSKLNIFFHLPFIVCIMYRPVDKIPSPTLVACESIEISSLRLHCGRAAFYRSIIIPPVVSWRNTVANRILLLLVLLAGQTDSRYQQKNVSVRTIFCFQRSGDVFTYKNNGFLYNLIGIRKIFQKFEQPSFESCSALNRKLTDV